MLKFSKTVSYILNHPLNRTRKFQALVRFLSWQISTRLSNFPQVISFVNETVLVMERGMTGATGNYYCGLHEVDDMAFLLHTLRAEDLFLDIGANVGSYTVLASGVVGAHTIAIEPIAHTFQNLTRNIKINNIEEKVLSLNIGVSNEVGILTFTSEFDTKNKVLEVADTSNSCVQIPVDTADNILSGRTANVIKIDVEGWETNVLKGMETSLKDPNLLAIIIETIDSSGAAPGDATRSILGILEEHGFKPYHYDPFIRKLISGVTNTNTIFIRDIESVKSRLKKNSQFKLINGFI